MPSSAAASKLDSSKTELKSALLMAQRRRVERNRRIVDVAWIMEGGTEFASASDSA